MTSPGLRHLARRWLPPALTEFLRDLHQRTDSRVDFRTFWDRFAKSSVPAELSDMVTAFVESPDFPKISRYWHYLNATNLEMIAGSGPENYRKNVSLNYFTWTDFSEELAGGLFQSAERSPRSPYAHLFRQQPGLDVVPSVRHNMLIAALHAAVMARPVAQRFAEVREQVGDSTPHLVIDGVRVTQDRLNALLEFERISLLSDFAGRRMVLEIGAGNGRTAACMMSLVPGIKYIIADIPPALFLSSGNLRGLFPERRVAVAFKASSLEELSALIRDNDLIFMFPYQIRLLADKSIDLFLAIDCLHEMTRATIDDYFAEIDRLARSFYMKVWNSTRVPLDLHRLTRDDYPVRPHWEKVFDEACVFPSNFCEMGYRL
jgi:putative sugar O-methyltransferase